MPGQACPHVTLKVMVSTTSSCAHCILVASDAADSDAAQTPFSKALPVTTAVGDDALQLHISMGLPLLWPPDFCILPTLMLHRIMTRARLIPCLSFDKGVGMAIQGKEACQIGCCGQCNYCCLSCRLNY